MLPNDTARCMGSRRTEAGPLICPHREGCARHVEWVRPCEGRRDAVVTVTGWRCEDSTHAQLIAVEV